MKGKAYIRSKGHIFYTVAAGLTWDINLNRSVREIVEAGCPCGAKHETTIEFDGEVGNFTRELGISELPSVEVPGRTVRRIDLASIPAHAMATA